MRNTVWPYLRQLITARNTLVLFTCIGIAAVFWLLQKMSLEYRYVIKVEASYTHNQDSVMLMYPLPAELQLEITSTGWQLFRYGLLFQLPQVTIDMNDYRNSRSLSFNTLRTSFTEQLNNRYQVESVFPAQVELEWQPQQTRRVPVRLIESVQIDPQYGLKGTIQLTPDSVIVSGPYGVVDTITYLYTDTLSLVSVAEPVSGTIAISRNQLQNIRINPTTVDYMLTVEPYTEATLQLPVTAVGQLTPQIGLMQQTITLQFQLPVSDYGLLADTSYLQLFEVVAQTDSIVPGDSTVPVALRRQPNNIRKVITQPTHIRFLFRNL